MVVLNFRGVLAGSQVHPLWLDLALGVLDRRAAAALVMISGVGVSLYASAAWNSARQWDLIRRGIFLIIAGSLLSLIWSGDILHVYGVLICMGVVLVCRSSKFLFLSGGLFLAGGVCRWLPLFDPIEAGGFVYGVDQMADLLFTGYFPLFPWAGIFIWGMLLGRVDIRKNRLILGGLALGVLCLASGISGNIDADWAWMDLSLPTLPATVSGMGTGMLLILMCDWAAGPSLREYHWFTAAAVSGISAAGRTSLTFYILHILVLVALAPLAGKSGLADLCPISLSAVFFYGFYASLSAVWVGRIGRGPLEQAMRKFPFIRIGFPGRAWVFPARP